MKLETWISKNGGAKKVAKMLGVNPMTVYTWVYRQSAPKDKIKIQINRLSRGAVSYKEMIEPFHSEFC